MSSKVISSESNVTGCFYWRRQWETAGWSGWREGGKLHEAIVDTQQSVFYYANKIYRQTLFCVTYQPMMGCGKLVTANGRIRIVLCSMVQKPLLCGIKGMFLLNSFFLFVSLFLAFLELATLVSLFFFFFFTFCVNLLICHLLFCFLLSLTLSPIDTHLIVYF